MKTVKSIQKIFEKKKIAVTVLFVSWLSLIENCNFFGAGSQKVGKIVSL